MTRHARIAGVQGFLLAEYPVGRRDELTGVDAHVVADVVAQLMGHANVDTTLKRIGSIRRASVDGMPLMRPRPRSRVSPSDSSAGAPDLTHAGRERDAKWLKDWITAPDEVDAGADMPAFGNFLTPEQMDALVTYLAERK